jgi:antitoxin (DNA-binding transcriptional repressor) of toxin-antitoxin stability system
MVEKIGIREFRKNIGKYVDAATPIAVSRHGRTVGYFIPVHREPDQAEMEALRASTLKLETLLADQGISEEELVQEFRQLRERR